MRNYELKVRLPASAATEAWLPFPQRLAALDAKAGLLLQQTDIYFAVPQGRLKLRQTTGGPDGPDSELIHYQRADQASIRASDYTRTELADPLTTARELAEQWGIRAVIRKTRGLYLWRHSRIHLDTVEGLGRFVEIETVDQGQGDAAALAEAQELAAALTLDSYPVESKSYVDLAEATGVGRLTPDELPGLL